MRRRQRLQEPDVRDRRGQVDVAEALTTHLGLDDLDAALLADDAAVLHALVLAAVALVVLDGPKDLRAEETVPLRLERAVVDRLRLLHFAVGPLADLVRRRQRDADRAERKRILRLLEEVEDVFHGVSFDRLTGLGIRLDSRWPILATSRAICCTVADRLLLLPRSVRDLR